MFLPLWLFYNPNVPYKTQICYLYTRVIDQACSAGWMLAKLFFGFFMDHDEVEVYKSKQKIGQYRAILTD